MRTLLLSAGLALGGALALVPMVAITVYGLRILLFLPEDGLREVNLLSNGISLLLGSTVFALVVLPFALVLTTVCVILLVQRKRTSLPPPPVSPPPPSLS